MQVIAYTPKRAQKKPSPEHTGYGAVIIIEYIIISAKKTVSCRIKNRRSPVGCDGTFICIILLFFSLPVSFVQQISSLNWEICLYLLHFIIPIQAWTKGHLLCPLIWLKHSSRYFIYICLRNYSVNPIININSAFPII